MSEPTETPARLNPNSYISLGLVVIVIAGILWIKDGQSQAIADNKDTASALTQYKEIQAKNAEILGLKLEGIKEMLTQATHDPYNRIDARTMWKRFAEMNPNLRVPEVP